MITKFFKFCKKPGNKPTVDGVTFLDIERGSYVDNEHAEITYEFSDIDNTVCVGIEKYWYTAESLNELEAFVSSLKAEMYRRKINTAKVD